MIKIVLFFFIFSTCSHLCYSQNCQSYLNQIFITKVVIRNTFGSIDAIECNNIGISLIKIFKDDDSIKIKSLYYSCSAYDLSADRFLLKALNKYCKDSIPNACAIILPFYFYYMPDSGELKKPEKWKFSAMESVISKLDKKDIIIFDPIEYTSYWSITDRRIDEPYIVPIKRDSTNN